MPIFSYQVFLAIVEHKSFAQAAQFLYLTPSAVSQTIARLEQECGLHLFVRDRSGARLTQDGERLLPFVRAILDAEKRLAQEIADVKGLETGTIGVGVFNSVCVNWLPDMARSFMSDYPNISIQIYQGGYSDVQEWIRGGQVEIGFSTHALTDTDEYEITPLFRDRIICATSTDFRPSHADYVTIDDIRDQPFVHLRSGLDAEIRSLMDLHGLSGHKSFSIENIDSLIAIVEGGFGICLLPKMVLKRIVHNVSIYPLEPPVFRTIVLITPKNRPLSAAAQRFSDHIVTFLQTNQVMNV